MSAASILLWIPVFPLVGFLINGLLYLGSHSKLGTKTGPGSLFARMKRAASFSSARRPPT